MKTRNRQPDISHSPAKYIIGAAALLLTLAVTQLCSAAEVTFGPRDNYSVQLPDTWTATVDKEKKLGANGPARLTLNAFIGSTETPPEALMEKIITSSAQKKAGYKLIEKGSVKTKAGGQAFLHRYELAAKSGTEVWVDYYLQLAKEEVVILVFAFPSGAPKSVRSEIEAIFNSVKVATAAAQEDSWLTTPADKSKESSKGAGAGNSEIAGKYISTQKSSDYIILKADGTFSYQISGESGTSTYTRNGATITLVFDGDPDDAKLERDALVDSQGKRWVKSSTPPAPAAPAEKSDGDSKVAGTQDSKIAGTYVLTKRPTDYIVLKADGPFTVRQEGELLAGTYTSDGATVTFKFSRGTSGTCKLDKDTLIDQDGDPWVRRSQAPVGPKTSGTQVTFATNCAVELPAGWTAKASGKNLEGKGPDGATFDGFSVPSATALDASMAEHLSVFEKMPGYELVDTDEISTKAGAKGTLAYYRYNRPSGPTAEVGVIIKVAPNQLVTLRFLTPSTTKKLPDTFMHGTEAIFSSLKVSK